MRRALHRSCRKGMSCVGTNRNYESPAGAPLGLSMRRKVRGAWCDEDGGSDCMVACHKSRHVPTLSSLCACEGLCPWITLVVASTHVSDCHITGLGSPPGVEALAGDCTERDTIGVCKAMFSCSRVVSLKNNPGAMME